MQKYNIINNIHHSSEQFEWAEKVKHLMELTCLLIADGGGKDPLDGYLLSNSPEMSGLSSRIKPLYTKKGVSRVCLGCVQKWIWRTGFYTLNNEQGNDSA